MASVCLCLKLSRCFPSKLEQNRDFFFFWSRATRTHQSFVPNALEFVCKLLILVHIHHLKQFILNGSALSYSYDILWSFCSQLRESQCAVHNCYFNFWRAGVYKCALAHPALASFFFFIKHLYASRVSFKFLMWPKMTLNFWFSCLHLPTAGFTLCTHHHAVYAALGFELSTCEI